jgi:glutaredoxin
MVMGTFTTTIVTVQANPSITNTSNTIPTGRSIGNRIEKPQPNSPKVLASEPLLDTVSGKAETELVEHLVAQDVKFYGAYWCDHCQRQKSLFGAEAAAKLPYVECAADAEKSQRQLCKEKKIQMFPTWVIDGKYFTGTKDLKEIAKLTGYQGSMNFKYRK